jgi:hypothetical protein
MDRDRALPLLRFEIVGLALPLLVAAFEEGARPDVGLILQQSISSITNIDDIESYISSKETSERRYLHMIDLPMSERPHVIRELSVMGITAGSLFPGLDGECEELKERNFDLYVRRD